MTLIKTTWLEETFGVTERCFLLSPRWAIKKQQVQELFQYLSSINKVDNQLHGRVVICITPPPAADAVNPGLNVVASAANTDFTVPDSVTVLKVVIVFSADLK